MKQLMLFSLTALTIASSSIIFAKNSTKTSQQSLIITNKTSIPLTISMQASYIDEKTQKPHIDKKSFTLKPAGQNSFNYRVIKKPSKDQTIQQGGLDSMTISTQNKILAHYTSQINTAGEQYFEQAAQLGDNYHQLNIYENTDNTDKPLLIGYEKMKLNTIATNNPIGTKVEYSNTTGGYNRY